MNTTGYIITPDCANFASFNTRIISKSSYTSAFAYGEVDPHGEPCKYFSKKTYVDEHGLKHITNYILSGNSCVPPGYVVKIEPSYEGSYKKITAYSTSGIGCYANGSSEEVYAINDKGVVEFTGIKCDGISTYHREYEGGTLIADCTANQQSHEIVGHNGYYCEWKSHWDIVGTDGDTDISEHYDVTGSACCDLDTTEYFDPPIQEPYTLYENPVAVINNTCCESDYPGWDQEELSPCQGNHPLAYNFDIEEWGIINQSRFKFKLFLRPTYTCYLKVWFHLITQNYQLVPNQANLPTYWWDRNLCLPSWRPIGNPTISESLYTWDKREGGCPNNYHNLIAGDSEVEVIAGLGTTVRIKMYKYIVYPGWPPVYI